MNTFFYDKIKEFVGSFGSKPNKAEEASLTMLSLSSDYAKENDLLAALSVQYCKKLLELADGVDETTGKPISAAKAEIAAQGSSEYEAYILQKAKVQGVLRCVDSLDLLTRGIISDK